MSKQLFKQPVRSKNNQRGQSLIETLVAIFILITGLIAAITLAINSLYVSDTTQKQIIATALAREAIEGVRNIRDEYWLNDTLSTCNFSNGTNQPCRANWQGPVGNQKLKQGTYSVDYSAQSWTINKNPTSYVLNYHPTTGVYSTAAGGTPSVYSRKVDMVENTSAPYDSQNPRVEVTSTVWWTGKKCNYTTDPNSLPNNCKVILMYYLTNWKNY